MKKLLVQSALGLLFLLVCLALALFLSAGSRVFPQAWRVLVVWTLCSVLITIYLSTYDHALLARRVQAGPIAETQRVQQILQGVAGVCFISLFIVAGLDVRFHWSHIPSLISWLALGGMILGFGIVFLVFRANTYTSATIEVAHEQHVIATGPYRVVRHPMYAGAILVLVGTALALGSWVALFVALVLIGIVIIRLREEERFLRAELIGYDAYCQMVRYRLMPLIW